MVKYKHLLSQLSTGPSGKKTQGSKVLMCTVWFTHKAQERPRAAKGNGKLGRLGKGNLGARKHALSGSEWDWKISGPPKGVTNRAIHCAWEAERKGFQRQFGPVLSLMRVLWGEYDWFRTTRVQVSEPYIRIMPRIQERASETSELVLAAMTNPSTESLFEAVGQSCP